MQEEFCSNIFTAFSYFFEIPNGEQVYVLRQRIELLPNSLAMYKPFDIYILTATILFYTS